MIEDLKEAPEARFDWYQATLPDNEDNVIAELLERLNLGHMSPVRGVPQYDRTMGLFRDFGDAEADQPPVCAVSYGGNAGAHPHVKATGRTAQEVSEAIRACWPKHRVSRLDSAYDLILPDLWYKIVPKMEAVWQDRSIPRDKMGVPENGETYYLGSRKSNVRVRAYEKGKEQGFFEKPYCDWVRIELQVRPRTADKGTYAAVSPCDAWGAAAWSGYLVQSILDIEPYRVARMKQIDRDLEDKAVYILQQYSKTIRQIGADRFAAAVLAFDHGGPDAAYASLRELPKAAE